MMTFITIGIEKYFLLMINSLLIHNYLYRQTTEEMAFLDLYLMECSSCMNPQLVRRHIPNTTVFKFYI